MSLPPLGKVAARARLMLDSRLPVKPVKRKVRGIEMVLPRGHALPYFTHPGSLYFDNLVALATSLAGSEGEVTLLDIGANVGDTALVVLDAAPGRAVCVEPDPHWHGYLQSNVGALDNVAVEHSVLVSPETDQTTGLKIARAELGSSIVERTSLEDGLPTITTTALREKYPELQNVRLIKSDTDGYDVQLVTAVSATFLPSKPVIFFEFDPVPTRIVNPEVTPSELWPTLEARGYERAVLWDNGGGLIGSFATAELVERTAELERTTKEERGYSFWDVAVAHRDDPAGLKALEDAARVG